LVTTLLWSVATPEPSGAIGAACEAGTAANVSAATANARRVFLIEFLLRREAMFEVRAGRQARGACTLCSYHKWNDESVYRIEI
jgi:hypothetical protein